ncbi:MAG: putative bifunctional diguanylate cyclase/phosphodiesterase [Angustibacter sp.]
MSRARGPLIALTGALLATLSVLAVSWGPVLSVVVRSGTALAAAVALLVAAQRRDGLTASKRLLGVGLLAGGVAATLPVILTGHPADPSSPLQLLGLSYAPFAVACVVVVPTYRGLRVGALAEGVTAAAALWYLSLQLRFHVGRGADGDLVGASYAIVGAFMLAAIVSVYPRAVRHARAFLRRGGLGLALLLVSDSAYAVAVAGESYDRTGWIAQLYQLGLVAVLSTAFVRGSRDVVHADAETPADLRGGTMLSDLVVPYGPLAVALLVAGWTFLSGEDFRRADMLPILLAGLGMLARQAAAAHDHHQLVAELEARERTARAETLLDPLTGLANRRGFLQFLGQALTDVTAHPVGVAMVDLNDFKDVNDTHGHETGDRLLQECARRLLAAMPADGVVARLGGDEFAICQKGARGGGEPLAQMVVDAFDGSFVIGRREFSVRPSVGVVLDERAPGRSEARDGEHLLAHADVAMYQAKADKDVQHAPAVVLTGAERTRAASVIRLREEIATRDLAEFHLLYQPVVDLRTGVLRGVEALLRWRHPDLGEISPVQFIPMAEQVGAMGRLGTHVLHTSLAQLAAWAEVAPDVRLGLGVNLSARQLGDPALPLIVREALRRNEITPDQLVLEITESALMEDLETAAGLVEKLRADGVSVAIDDYGTGYSSLRYLRRFAADVLKIDREFVGALVDDARTAVLVRSVIDVAAGLDLQTIAEGIETVEQLRACQQQGAELGQGYLFSRPVEAEEITRMLLSGRVFEVVTEAELAAPGASH